jgi:two-component system sensor histidine kinase KdpD
MTVSDRPNPDELLRTVTEEDRRQSRGKLTIFFGAAPGVGKTYAMLEAARAELLQEKRDVVVGVIETHGRYDTGALLLGLPILPRKRFDHRGIVIEEFALDAALERHPAVLLVDELAHTNAEGSRHAKRWQDVDELLDAGIDVYTTLNVQHVESLNDVVAQITGVLVRETVPDSFIEQASEVHLVDLPPDQLLERLREGKVYLPAQATRAAENFFRKGNLIALRELALRHTAERVDADMRVWKAAHGIERTWATTERLLVGLSPSPTSSRLVRAARRMASTLHASWIAVYVETPASIRLSAAARDQLAQNLRLAQQLGAETVTLTGESAAAETIAYARKRNVSKIVVGKPTHPRWKDLFGPSFLDEIVRSSGDADVYVISGDDRPTPAPASSEVPNALSASSPWRGYAASAAVIGAATAISWKLFGWHQLADVVMVMLLGIVVVAMRFGYGPSIVAAVLGVLSFDFFFVPPYFTFAVTDLRHILTFAIMFLVAIVISSLTQRIRAQADAARDRENRTASLYAMSRELAAAASTEALFEVAVRHVADVFGCRVAILTPNADGVLVREGDGAGGALTFAPDEKDMGVAEWAWAHDRRAGLATDTLPSASALYVPLLAGKTRVGVVGILPRDARRFSDPSQGHLLDAFTGQIATAIERAKLADTAQRARVEIETEQLKNSLLSSVSHDLRTPLAVITGSAATLAEPGIDRETQKELLDTIQEEGHRLNRLVRNLLDMTRLQAGALQVKKEWQDVEEVIGSALTRLEDRLTGRVVETTLPDDLPMAPFDSILMEQVLINLMENAIKYTPAGSPIEIAVRAVDKALEVSVLDRGPGVPPADVEKVFEKFYKASEGRGGVGLGLTICRGIVTAHGGRLWVEPRVGGGAAFRFTIPLEGGAPALRLDEPLPASRPPVSP